MKRIICLLSVPFILASCQQKPGNSGAESSAASTAAGSTETVSSTEATAAADTGATAKFEFTETAYDFGTIQEGEKVTHSYSFKNVGTTSLIISKAQPSCGCTVPDWTREPIPPGGTGEIKAVFDSKGRVGKQSKSITVYANTDPSMIHLSLTGEVKANAK